MTNLRHVSVTILGETQYDRAFIAYEHEVSDLQEPLGGARDILSRHARDQFASEGRHASGGWKTLNPAYEKWKQAHYPGKPILQRTSELRDQLVDHGTIELGPHRLVWGVHPQAVSPEGGRPALYGARHQTGDSSHGLPQRKIVNLRDDERRQIDREFAEFLNGLRHKIIGAPR